MSPSLEDVGPACAITGGAYHERVARECQPPAPVRRGAKVVRAGNPGGSQLAHRRPVTVMRGVRVDLRVSRRDYEVASRQNHAGPKTEGVSTFAELLCHLPPGTLFAIDVHHRGRCDSGRV